MRIACLQFAPQVGDVNNNLNRADSVLAKANPADLEDLDLIVLPELAFTGYNFKSLNEISPYLEPQGSGISALWARTTALKYDTNVIVGYPERVDVSPKWPTGPEYYSSAIVVNGDGETIANYRKSFLYAIDETWALEGDSGFFAAEIPGLGNAALGICMDLNPYRFETPWHAFEFAYHIQSVEANLVIVSMAWLTREDGRHFTRMPEEADIETLTYWVQRLEPLIRNEGQEEIIVVFCNRTGIEGEVVYAGTSSVVGIKDGEVKVYGILGRGVKDLLVVDTENGAFAKLIQRPKIDNDLASHVSGMSRRPRKSAAVKPSISKTPGDSPLWEDVYANGGPRRPTPTPDDKPKKPRKTRPQSPKIQIPDSSFYTSRGMSGETPIDESPGVATPTCPSPTPWRLRPNISSPDAQVPDQYADTLSPSENDPSQSPHIYGGCVSIEGPDPTTASPSSGQLSGKYYWSDVQAPLKSPMAFRFPDVYKQVTSDSETPVPSSIVRIQHEERLTTKTLFKPSAPLPSAPSREPSPPHQPEQATDHKQAMALVKSSETSSQDFTPPRPSSPKSRNASRTGRPLSRRFSEFEQPDLSGTAERLESMAQRPGSAVDWIYHDAEEARLGRAQTRNSNVTGAEQQSATSQGQDIRFGISSPPAAQSIASPSASSDTTVQTRSTSFRNMERTIVRPSTALGTIRPCPRAGAHSINRSLAGHSTSQSRTRSGSAGSSYPRADAKPHIEPDETRTLVWSELSKMVGEVLNQAPSRDVSRGRPRLPGHSTGSSGSAASRETHSETRPGPRVIPRAEQRFASQVRSESAEQAPIRTIVAAAGTEALPQYNPDDEIVAEIIFHTQSRPAQGGTNSPHARDTSQASRSSKSSPTQNATPSKPAPAQRADSGQSKTSSHRSNSQQNKPQPKRQDSSLSKSLYERRPSAQDSQPGKSGTKKLRDNLGIMSRVDSNESCPTMDGESTHTVSSQENSPGTPPARYFEPTTPKAMSFDPTSRTVVSSIPKNGLDSAPQL